jgi:hypothetical protein
MTLFGASLVVCSSSLYYLSTLVWAAAEGPFSENPWLNHFVLIGSVNSILVDVGMVFISGVLKQVTWTSMTTLLSSACLRIEKRWHASARSHAHPKMVAALLALVVLCIACLPLFLTGTTSFGAAKDVCYERQLSKLVAMAQREGRPFDKETHFPSHFHLFPLHMMNVLSTVVSLAGLWIWLFFSPHTTPAAVYLDRTCMHDKCVPTHFLRSL